ncbi:MAG: PAS domain S-box protein, partial [Bacteroidales bacterium]|nr:PAS domain S-box protein [Bacteroidales bacterium]MBN2819879.1 PAS domain S-box protein [Bacteroidales bacterium]
MQNGTINMVNLFNNLMDSIQQGIVVLDKDLRIIRANKMILSKVSANETVIGSYCYKTIRNSKTPCTDCPVLKTFETANPNLEILKNPLNEKNEPIYEITSNPVISENGEVELVIESYRDITPLTQFKNRLFESEERFKTFVENVNDIIYHLTPEGVFTYVSPNWTEILGYQPNETIGEKVEKFAHPDDLHLCIDFLNKVLTTGEKQSGVEYRVKHKNGTWRWHNSTGAPIKDENGNFVSYIGVGRDVTEQKIALEEKIRRKTLFDNVLSTIPDLVSIHDKDLNIIFSNWNGFGAVPLDKRILNSKCYNTYRGYDSICPDCQAKKVLETKKIYHSQALLPDGKWIDIRVFPIIDPIDEKHVFVEWVRDISEIKQSEQSLKEKNEEYEALNEELRQTNLELIFAKEKAEESETDLRFLFENMTQGVVYHNPLGKIIRANAAAARILGLSLDQLYGITPINSRWKSIHEDGTDYPGETHPAMVTIKTKEPIKNSIMGIFNPEENDYSWININSVPQLNSENQLIQVVVTFEDITEIKNAREKAEESEERFNLAMQASNDGLFDWNLETNEIYYSPGWKKILGYEDHELPNDISIWESLTEPQDLKKSWKLQQKLITKQIDRFVLEFKMKHKKGYWVEILARAEAIFNNSGKAVRIVGTHTDITRRKQIELELAESAERFKALHNASFGGIGIHDKGLIIECNQGLSKMTGYAYDELIGMDGLLLIAPESRNIVMSRIMAGYENPYEALGIRKNGEIYPLRLEARNIPYKGKKVRTVEFRDITEQKQVEQQINAAKEKAEESQRKFKAIADTSPLALYISKGVRQVLEYINPTFYRLFGYKYKEVNEVALWWKLAYPDPDYQKQVSKEWNSRVEKAIETKSDIVPMETIVTCKDGSKKNILWGLVSTGDENWAFGMDLTEYRKTEKELTIAKEKAEEANHLKTEFLNNMSHEVRTPMNGIIGFSEMLDKPDITDEKRKYYSKIIQNSSYQLLRIIDDILEISTLETKQEKLNETEFCLNDLLMELFSIFNLKSKERNLPLYLRKALHDKQSHIISDKTKLNKILSNLLENALKFTNQGYIEFGYFIENTNLILYVKDTGVGISSKNHEIVFERFSQEDKEVSSKHGGLGLGLSICKENTQLLGGNITLKSEKGKGSTFYVTIPYKPVQIESERVSMDSS